MLADQVSNFILIQLLESILPDAPLIYNAAWDAAFVAGDVWKMTILNTVAMVTLVLDIVIVGETIWSIGGDI